MRLQGEKESKLISNEIEVVIKKRVTGLAVELELNGLEQSTLEQELLSMGHRTYLWLKLVMELILEEVSLG
jgi:hypothetical protein